MHVVINLLVISSVIKYSLSDLAGKTAVQICSCYAFYGTKTRDVLSWTASRQRCNSTGGDLVSMETREEWEFIRDEIQSRWAAHNGKGWKNEWHIGLMKLDGTWTWVSGKRLENTKTGQWPWQPLEPNNEQGTEDVAVMAKNYPEDERGLFNDIKRSGEKRGFICERVEDSCKDDYSEQWSRTLQSNTSARPKTSNKSTNVTPSKSNVRSTATAIISKKAPKINGKSSEKDHNIKTTRQTPPTSNSCKDSVRWCRTQLETSARPKTSTKGTNVTPSKSNVRSTATAIISTKAPKINGRSSSKDHNIKTTGQTPPTSISTEPIALPSDAVSTQSQAHVPSDAVSTQSPTHGPSHAVSTKAFVDNDESDKLPTESGTSAESVNSTIILLLTGIIVLVVALVLLLVILYRRRSQKKRSIRVSNDNGNGPSADAQETPAQPLYAVVHKNKKDKTKKSPQLVYVELSLSRKGEPTTVAKPEPYQPTTYAEICPAQAPPAAANQNAGPTENQPAEDPTYAGIV